MNELKEQALLHGARDFGVSERNNKRFYVIYNDKKINFGSKDGHTYYDEKNEIKRDNWYKRHSNIKNKYGENVIYMKTSPSFWSANLLW